MVKGPFERQNVFKTHTIKIMRALGEKKDLKNWSNWRYRPISGR